VVLVSQIEKSCDLNNVLPVLTDMAMGTGKKRERQQDLWIASNAVVEPLGNAFYDRLNQILDEHHFDRRVEAVCRRFYKKNPYGRPSIAPGVYFRALPIGYFEGLDSERAIAWRAADSLSLRGFLGYALDEDTPDNSTPFADATVVLGGDTPGGVPLGPGHFGQGRFACRADDSNRRHHFGS
jgi:hypothetical protein